MNNNPPHVTVNIPFPANFSSDIIRLINSDKKTIKLSELYNQNMDEDIDYLIN